MPLLLDHLHSIRNVLLAQAAESQPLGLKMDGKEQSQIVEKCGQDGSDHHLGVVHSQELRHDKAHSAHDGRAELPARGGHRLHRPGKLLLVAGLLHQRDSDSAGGSHIGDGRAVDHAHKGGGQHCHLGGAAGSLSHQGQGKVVDKLGKATVL